MMEFNDQMWTDDAKIPVKLKFLSDTAVAPTYGSEEAACCDLYADVKSLAGGPEKIFLGEGETVKIPTGIAVQPPKGYCCLVYARSGIATRKGLRPANCVGVVDNDYIGNVIVALHNDSDEIQVIEHGDRIAQLAFVPYIQARFEVTDNLIETERADGGFGHTGK